MDLVVKNGSVLLFQMPVGLKQIVQLDDDDAFRDSSNKHNDCETM